MRLCLFGIAMVLNSFVQAQERSESLPKAYFYVGTYTAHLSETDQARSGIGLWSVNRETGALTREHDPWPSLNGSFVTLGKNKDHVYSVNEVGDYQGSKSGYLTQYTINPTSLALGVSATMTSHGPGPAYLSTDHSGKYLLLANYGAGNIVAYPIDSDGRLGTATANIQHVGSSTNPQRQKAPHPHSIVSGPDNRHVYVADLGLDRIKVYSFDSTAGTFESKSELDITTPPGSGPRHLTFHPSGKYAFCSLEMSSEIAAYRYANGQLSLIAIYPTLPDEYEGVSTTAEVRVSPNGKHVYISNRGHDSIAVFSLNEATGELDRIQIISTQGKTPRNFALDSTGTVLVVGNQNSNSLVSYRVNSDTGILTSTGNRAEVSAPTYICFY